MLVIGLASALVFGLPLGVALFIWQRKEISYHPKLYFAVSGIINLIRSFPFIILLISLVPLTRLIVGSTIGPVAASVPLAISAIPYFARLVEQSLKDIPKGIIEVSLSMGANTWQTVAKILLVEARSSLVLAFTTMTVSFISYTAVAGVVGGGGIGDLAIRYGYYRFQTDVMVAMVILLVVLVQTVQSLGLYVSRRIDHRL